jgi:hypothetical protein
MTNGTPKPSEPAELVEVLPPIPEPATRWTPAVGPETLALLHSIDLPADGRSTSEARIRDQAVQILARCIPPNQPVGAEVGLVIGYVQSGKTISFTTVAALARDNGYQMIIVIAGTSLPLLRQSIERLEKDLQLASRRDRKWQHFTNPSPIGLDRTHINNTLADWDDPEVPAVECRTVLITVMKHHGHLDNLADLLANIDMRRRPVLVIDDEADQAGLNTWIRNKDESATYRRLLRLRQALPHHSYLQYTATPQAPLLINLIDVLSPRFAEILEPGDDYVGGRDIFVTTPGLVETIPDSDIPSSTNVLNGPPDSLLQALRLFYLGVAAGLVQESGRGNRCMLVHPSQRTLAHGQYFAWVRSISQQWGALLDLSQDDPDRSDLILEFRESYKDLEATVPTLPAFDDLARRLKHAIRQTRIEEINARDGTTPSIEWGAAYPHILVGGQAMDRGFTIEGLTVTYMPRGIGIGNADNVQQRARFLGYKRRYLGYCRVFLEGAARDAYKNYVIHEEDVRARLKAHRDKHRPLTEWKREFFLTSSLKPTRRSVQGLDYMRLKFGDDWWYPSIPHDSAEAGIENRKTLDAFVASLELVPDDGHPSRTELMQHLVDAQVPLRIAYRSLLADYKVTSPDDSARYTALLILIEDYLEDHQDEKCSVYVISGGRSRVRGVEEKTGEMKYLFQGAHPDKNGAIYPGDARVKAAQGLTIQLHSVDVTEKSGIIAAQVPVVAIWIPARMAPDLVVQDQPLPS